MTLQLREYLKTVSPRRKGQGPATKKAALYPIPLKNQAILSTGIFSPKVKKLIIGGVSLALLVAGASTELAGQVIAVLVNILHP